MRFSFIFVLIVVGLFALCSQAQAGYVFYEKEDLRISVDELSAVVLYDFNAKEELAGATTSLVEYKMLNFDVGLIGNIDEIDEFEEVDAFFGISLDVNSLEFKDNVFGRLGFFASPGVLDNGPERYGVYAGISLKF